MEAISEKRGLGMLLLVAAVLGLAFDLLFFEKGLGVNYLMFVLLVLLGGWLLTGMRTGMNRSTLILAVPAVVLAAMVAVRSSPLLTFFNVLGSVLLLLALAGTYSGKDISDFLPLDFLKTVFRPFMFIVPFFVTVGNVFALRNLWSEHPARREVVRGLFMAVVAVGIFAALFASADLVFRKAVAHVFRFQLSGEVIAQAVIFLFVTVFFIGAYRYIRSQVVVAQLPPAPRPRSLGAIETSILLGSICLIFLVFIGLQVTYLFGGQSHLAELGLRYADYARRGFAEIVIASILAYVIISAAERQVVKSETSHIRSFKVLSTLLVVEVVAILVSAWFRLGLYEDAYGFSTIRLYSHALMAWIGLVLVFMAHHIHAASSNERFTFRVFVSVVLLLACMNALNPDAFIAQKNLERYHQTGKVDVYYLSTLSEDAVPETAVLLNDASEAVRREYTIDMYDPYCRSVGSQAHWQAFRFSAARSEQLLRPLRAYYIENQKDFLLPCPADTSFE